MSIEYTNRKNKRFYLHQSVTKTGKPRYFFSTKPDGLLVETLPRGYEIYESPNAQVFLRKITPKVIADKEIALVREAIQQQSGLQYYQIDVRRDTIVVYIGDQSLDSFEAIFPADSTAIRNTLRQTIEQFMTYTPVLRFQLSDPETRRFLTQRYCFLGSIDDWIFIGGSDSLEQLVQEYIPHLGKDSFYELF
jgi:hypothetical protein